MGTAWLAVLTYIGICAGLVVVWRRYHPDFAARYGDRSKAYLILFMVFPPALVVAHILDRETDPTGDQRQREQQ